MLSRPHRSLRSALTAISVALLFVVPGRVVPAVGSVADGARLRSGLAGLVASSPVAPGLAPGASGDRAALALARRIAVGSDTVIFDTTARRTALEPNRPNPFPYVTRIAYSIEADGHVVLTVRDFFYRTIQTLVDADQKAGRYEVAWPNAETAQTLSSGMYFCTLETSRGVEQLRMLLMK